MSVINDLSLMLNVTDEDPSLQEQNDPDSHLTLFILWGIILPLIAIAGLVGNILTIIVLWRKEMNSTTIMYLRGLVVTDTGILIGSVITLTPISCANYLNAEALEYFRVNVYPVIHAPGYYLIMTLQQCNVWITVSVSMERYIAICHPFRAARIITRRKTIIVLCAIVIISLLYNIPHLLATEASSCGAPSATSQPLEVQSTVVTGEGNVYDVPISTPQSTPLSIVVNLSAVTPLSGCLEVAVTEFGSTGFYNTYRTIMYSIIIYVIPFLALLILNSFLIKELMTMQQRRSSTNIHDENEANLSLVLVLIVIVFIFCQTPGLVSQFDLIPDGVFVSWLAFSNLLFTTNSAVNFLIYTAFGRKFRRVLLRVFRHIFKKKRRQFHQTCRTSQFSDGDVDLFEDTTDRCTSLRLISCYKKHSKANGNPSENIPLNTVKDTNTTTLNGAVHDLKHNSGTQRMLYTTVDKDSEIEGAISCGINETVSLGQRDKHDVTSLAGANLRMPPTPNSGLSRCDDHIDIKTCPTLNFEHTTITDTSNTNTTEVFTNL